MAADVNTHVRIQREKPCTIKTDEGFAVVKSDNSYSHVSRSAPIQAICEAQIRQKMSLVGSFERWT